MERLHFLPGDRFQRRVALRERGCVKIYKEAACAVLFSGERRTRRKSCNLKKAAKYPNRQLTRNKTGSLRSEVFKREQHFPVICCDDECTDFVRVITKILNKGLLQRRLIFRRNACFASQKAKVGKRCKQTGGM